MKNLKKYFINLLLIFPLAFTCAQSDSNKIKISQRIPPDLEIEVKVTAETAIAYANCFIGKVVNVNRGQLSDSVILITILPADTIFYKTLNSYNEGEVFRIFCMHNKSEEPYNTAFITGFVDSQKTSWKIIEIFIK